MIMTENHDANGPGSTSRSPGLRETGVGRVVILLDASRESMAALDAAAAFAHASRAELVGWFVEEEELVRCAGYPWTREVSLSGVVRPLQPGQVEQRLRNRAEIMRSALQRIARSRGLQAQLRVYRGRVIQKVLEEATGDDLLVLGKIGYRRALGLRVGSTARALMGRTAGPVMIYEHPLKPVSPFTVAVVVTAGDEGLRALRTALALARESGAPMVILLPMEDEDDGAQREHTVRTLLEEVNDHERVQSVRRVTVNRVVQILEEESAQRLVVPRQWALQAERRNADLVEAASMPVVVVP